MKPIKFAALASLALIAPLAASAQVYYYAPNTTSGAFNYGSSQYIPSAAMPYVQFGQQMQQQYQSQSQYQSYYPSYSYGYNPYSYGSYGYSYPTYQYAPSYYGYGYGYDSGYYSEPQSYSYPSGTYGPFNTQLCYWSDYPDYAPCGNDPQQWIQDPYTGQWY